MPQTASIISIFRGLGPYGPLNILFSQNGPHHRFQREKLLYWSDLAHQDHQNDYRLLTVTSRSRRFWAVLSTCTGMTTTAGLILSTCTGMTKQLA